MITFAISFNPRWIKPFRLIAVKDGTGSSNYARTWERAEKLNEVWLLSRNHFYQKIKDIKEPQHA